MTDNGPQFASKEFEAFASQYCFDHITSSPRYPQSNGLIEHMVQTVKQCMKKCAAAGQDPNLAMLIYRATPRSTSIPSPAELLNGRKYRALLPTRSLMQNAHGQIVREQMVEEKDKMSCTTGLPKIYHLFCNIRRFTYKSTHSITDGLQQWLPRHKLCRNQGPTAFRLQTEPSCRETDVSSVQLEKLLKSLNQLPHQQAVLPVTAQAVS